MTYVHSQTTEVISAIEYPQSRSSLSASSKKTIENNSIAENLSDDHGILLSDVTTESDSDNSTPTRVIGTSNPILDNMQKHESCIQKSSAPISRPQSVILSITNEKERSEEPTRPKTANIPSYDDIPIKSRYTSKESLPFDVTSNNTGSILKKNDSLNEIPVSRENLTLTSRSSSMISHDTYQQQEVSTNDHDDISSNSLELRTESDFDDESPPQQKAQNSDSYTPKSNRTIKSYASTDLGSDDKNYDIDDVDFIKPLQKSPHKKSKPIIFRCKKVSPVTKSSIPTKSKPSESYISARRNEKPRDILTQCMDQLDSPDWETTMTGIQTFLRLIRHHPQLVESQIHVITIALAKQVKSLRSQVARAACKAAGEFFSTHNKALEHESEDLTLHLLNRTADTNKFLRADAGRALDMMCDNLTTSKVIHILSSRGATHLNAVVRTSTAKLLNRLVSRLGCDKVFTMNKECRDKIIVNCANLLMEGSLETRNYAKDIFRQLSAHGSYNKVIFEVIPQRTYRNIEKTLKTIK